MSKATFSEKGIDCKGKSLVLGRIPLIMGTVNVTPDSFSDGGKFLEKERAVKHAMKLVEEGADILDIGGESTRPDSDPVEKEEELARVLPVIEELVRKTSIPISIDTRKAEVAEAALKLGCHMVNDVSACSDESMPEVLCKYGVPVVIMHMKGEPKTMQVAPYYDDVVGEVKEFLHDRAKLLIQSGIPAERIIVDPGIGFGKRFRDNLDLINRIEEIKALRFPVLIGASRKRFLGELLDANVHERLFGDLAVAASCYAKGINILRVHDVRPTRELLRVLDALASPSNYSA